MKRMLRILTSAMLVLALLISTLALSSCEKEVPQISGAYVIDGELSLAMNDGTDIKVGKLPENDGNLTFTKATVTYMNILQVTFSDGKILNCGVIPTFSADAPLISATINEKAQLVLTTNDGDIVFANMLLTAYGACDYAETRNTDGRETVTVEIMFRGYGAVTLLLDKTTAPATVANFVKLANDGFYNGLTIHRIQDNFMIQGGCTKGDGTGGSSDKITGEFSSNGHNNDISHIRGVISMARSNDKNSASSQFFICNGDSTFLDGNYAAFGYVINGMSIIDALTYNNLKYATGDMGVIPNKTKQPVIEYVKVID